MMSKLWFHILYNGVTVFTYMSTAMKTVRSEIAVILRVLVVSSSVWSQSSSWEIDDEDDDSANVDNSSLSIVDNVDVVAVEDVERDWSVSEFAS